MTTEPQVPKDENIDDAGPVLTLIKQIKENKVDPAVLSAEDRRRCVDVLWSEGYTVADTAQILKCGERTIYRDRSALRAAHALRVHPQFALEMAGELMRQAESSAGRLRRIARESGASAMERCMAENFAFRVHLDTISKLQSMGYLPRVPTGVVAQVVGASGGEAIATYDQLDQRIQELDLLDQERGVTPPEDLKRRRELAEIIQRGRIALPHVLADLELAELADHPRADEHADEKGGAGPGKSAHGDVLENPQWRKRVAQPVQIVEHDSILQCPEEAGRSPLQSSSTFSSCSLRDAFTF